jgi:secreted trypsin-like serine protease
MTRQLSRTKPRYSKSRKGLSALFLAPLLSACGSTTPAEPTATTSSAIVDGTDDDGDPEVVALLANGAPTCSGTVVAPTVVLTAAHCVTPVPPDQVVAAPIPSAGHAIDVIGSAADPAFDPETLANDLGVVFLSSPIAVQPAALADTAPQPGGVLRVVGFGGTSPVEPVEARRERIGFVRVVSVRASSFTTEPYPSQPCGGDSGGAAFPRTGGVLVLAGVVSSGDAACTAVANFTRVDVARTWMDTQLAPGEPPSVRCSVTHIVPAGEFAPTWVGVWTFLLPLVRTRRRLGRSEDRRRAR